MANLENLHVLRVSSFDEEAERLEAKFWNEEYDEELYRGLHPEVVATMLDAVGSTGNNPIIATILYQVGIEKPGQYQPPSRSNDFLLPIDRPVLFGVYLDEGSVSANKAPDALLLAQGAFRKPYRGYEVVTTDMWVNPANPKVKNIEREVRDKAQKAMLSDYYDTEYIFVEQDTVLHEMGQPAGKTIEDLGIKPEEYADGCGEPTIYDRMNRLKDVTSYDGQPELLEALRDFYAALAPEVEDKGGETEDLYRLTLDEAEIAVLNNTHIFDDNEPITGLSISREDRPEGEVMQCPPNCNCDSPYYTNGWGDMTVRINIERENVVTTYSLAVFMDVYSETHLQKYTTELVEYCDKVSEGAAELLATIEDPMDEEMEINKIDEFEYQSLIKLVRSVQAITAPA